jgi:sulfate permease, SulP family
VENAKPQKPSIASDLIAGLTSSIAGIPDGLASGVLAGVNPINGLYSLMIGTPIAALFTGSAFMTVQTTSAMCITIGTVMAGYQGEQMIPALMTIALVVGVFQLLAGILRLGFLVRFVSNAVMTGFLSGLGVLVIFSQLGDLTGYYSEYSNKIVKGIDLLFHLNEVDVPTTIIGLLAIALIVVLDRTRLSKFSMLLALLIVSIIPLVLNWDSVALVIDTGSIPRGLPIPMIPTPIWNSDLITAGIAVAIIGLIQAAGISLGYPNPDGKYPNVSRDFTGQGIANLSMSVFQGVPVGGSLTSTALVVSAGAKSRLANIFTGLFAIVAVLLFAPVIEILPMAGLAAILIIAGIQSINVPRIQLVWQTNVVSRLIMIVTFIATLALPVQAAVLVGVILSFVLYIYRAADKFRVIEIVPMSGGRYETRPAPEELSSNHIVILNPRGNLFFASAVEFEENLPKIRKAERPVVILRLRGIDEIGSTFERVLVRYSDNLKANQGKLVLAGISKSVYIQLQNTGVLDQIGKENVYKATSIMGDSALTAYQDAIAWLEKGKVANDTQEKSDNPTDSST